MDAYWYKNGKLFTTNFWEPIKGRVAAAAAS